MLKKLLKMFASPACKMENIDSIKGTQCNSDFFRI